MSLKLYVAVAVALIFHANSAGAQPPVSTADDHGTVVIAPEKPTNVWQPTEGHSQVPIWPGVVPDALAPVGPEDVDGPPGDVEIHNVSRPTMTVYAPKGRNTGAAVLVFPGGGYRVLSIDLEGTEICGWMTSKGILCVLLKYRVPNSGPHWDRTCNCQIDPKAPLALQDAQRTLGLVRYHAKEWHVDPDKIGVIGFSAGGHVAASLSTHFQTRAYAPVDAADIESCRPDFAIVLYPGHLAMAVNSIDLNPDIESHITPQTPPTFLLQNEDDHVDSVEDALSYYMALKRVGIPVELHLYEQGGHGFGLTQTKLPVSAWPHLVETWLGALGMI